MGRCCPPFLLWMLLSVVKNNFSFTVGRFFRIGAMDSIGRNAQFKGFAISETVTHGPRLSLVWIRWADDISSESFDEIFVISIIFNSNCNNFIASHESNEFVEEIFAFVFGIKLFSLSSCHSERFELCNFNFTVALLRSVQKML